MYIFIFVIAIIGLLAGLRYISIYEYESFIPTKKGGR